MLKHKDRLIICSMPINKAFLPHPQKNGSKVLKSREVSFRFRLSRKKWQSRRFQESRLFSGFTGSENWIKKLDHRRRLIDSFVNAIFLYDDRITFTFNYKDGTKTITFAVLEKSGLGSDITTLAAPSKR